MSKNPQTVKTQVSYSVAFAGDVSVGDGFPVPQKMWKTSCCARHFDLLHNSSLTVPMYADRLELLVFGAPLTSVSLSKTSFLTD